VCPTKQSVRHGSNDHVQIQRQEEYKAMKPKLLTRL